MERSERSTLIIKNGLVLTMDETFSILERTSVRCENGVIAEMGPYEALTRNLEPDGYDELDANGLIVMPGMICAHTHFYGAFSRGMALRDEAPGNFVEILERLWWKLDRALSERDVFHSALLCMADAIRHGTTTLLDHHASPNFIEGSLDVIAKAADVLGVRTCLCYEVTDRNGPEGARKGIEENARFLRRVREGGTGIHRGSFGLHASLTLCDDTLRRCVEEAGRLESGFHVHVAEDMADNRDSQEKYGKSVVRRFHELGMLGGDTLASHCVHVSDEDIRLLSETGTQVMHNPQSNMNNAVGVAPVEKMQDAGLNVGLGTDGFSQDMWREMKFVYVLHKLQGRDPRLMGGDNVLRMQTHGNARIASRFWKEPLGVVKEGALADLIVVDYRPPTRMTGGNLPWHVQFGMDATNVIHTVINGRVVMEHGKVRGWNAAKMAEVTRALSEECWGRL